MKRRTISKFWLLLLFLTSCQPDPQPQIDLLIRQVDSLRIEVQSQNNWMYEIEKEGRIQAEYTKEDLDSLRVVCKDMAFKDQKNSKFWRRFGEVLGGVAKVVVPVL